MWCVVCGVWCVVCGVWCVVCGVWCVCACVVCVYSCLGECLHQGRIKDFFWAFLGWGKYNDT